MSKIRNKCERIHCHAISLPLIYRLCRALQKFCVIVTDSYMVMMIALSPSFE